MNKGIWYAVGAYVSWGLFPIYWKLLHAVPAPQLLAHRIVWSFLTLLVIILILRRWRAFRASIRNARVVRTYALAGVLVGINWLTFVWAVNAGFVVESSLGYFINPLLSVVFGLVFFRERLRPWQWLPVGLTTAAVLYLTITFGSLPWIALTLAVSFGFYSVVKKKAPLDSLSGLTLETGILFLPALAYLVVCGTTGTMTYVESGWATNLLLAGAGLVTTLPLLLFASSVQRIPLSLIAMLQYINPTLQLLCGVVLYHEPFPTPRLVAFCVVWAALVLFAIEGIIERRRHPVRANVAVEPVE